MKLVRKNRYNNDIIFVDGHAGVGKAIVGAILECYDNVEKKIEYDNIHLITSLHQHKKITDDVAIVLLQTSIDRIMHNLMLCRRINIRYTDIQSIFKYPYPLKYLKRYFIKDRNNEYYSSKYVIEDMVNKEKPLLQYMTQNIISSYRLLYKAFGDNLKIIYIRRNPIDVVYDMYQRDFINKIGIIPSNIRYTIEKEGNEPIPIFAKDWKEKYNEMNDIDKAIKWIYDLTMSDNDAYRKLHKKYKGKILIIDFDELVTNPYDTLYQFDAFIERKRTWKMDHIIKKEGCPRIIDTDKLNEKKEYIMSRCNDESKDYINELLMIYDEERKHIQ